MQFPSNGICCADVKQNFKEPIFKKFCQQNVIWIYMKAMVWLVALHTQGLRVIYDFIKRVNDFYGTTQNALRDIYYTISLRCISTFKISNKYNLATIRFALTLSSIQLLPSTTRLFCMWMTYPLLYSINCTQANND